MIELIFSLYFVFHPIVESYKEKCDELEKQLSSVTQDQSGQIDKNLVKSLLIGYVVSENPNDKQQILRMISSMLEFTSAESDKVGLNKQATGWLSSLLGGTHGAAVTQSGGTSTGILIVNFHSLTIAIKFPCTYFLLQLERII